MATHIVSYRMAGNFRGESEKALKINFVVLNFVTATSPGAWHCCISDDVIDTHARNLLSTKPYLQRLGQKV